MGKKPEMAWKIYWRETTPGRWHAFCKLKDVYVSLCWNHTLQKSGGQKIMRPVPVKRCAKCDNAESELHGSDGSLPQTGAGLAKASMAVLECNCCEAKIPPAKRARLRDESSILCTKCQSYRRAG